MKFQDCSKDCTETMKFLNAITDLDQCFRIRFMLLEPGGKILPHSDAHHLNVLIKNSIALNAPEGCKFIIDCNPDGTHHDATQIVPFAAGNLVVLNVAKYHYVVNDSSEPRIHLIVSGPIRIPEHQILNLAYRQNGLKSEASLIKEIAKKYRRLGDRGFPNHIIHRLGL